MSELTKGVVKCRKLGSRVAVMLICTGLKEASENFLRESSTMIFHAGLGKRDHLNRRKHLFIAIQQKCNL